MNVAVYWFVFPKYSGYSLISRIFVHPNQIQVKGNYFFRASKFNQRLLEAKAWLWRRWELKRQLIKGNVLTRHPLGCWDGAELWRGALRRRTLRKEKDSFS
ncbi:hypothetical protein DMUE_2729 [Dictyocoela muelleri]|nr:hypothetical protein DMUE_2729 [Dictyocoela muelleri]